MGERCMEKGAFEGWQTLAKCCSLCLASFKMAWHSNFTIAVFSPHSACLFAFAPLLLQNIDCILLAPRTPLLEALLFAPLCVALCLRFVDTGMCWLHSPDPGVKRFEIASATAVLGTNCIPKRLRDSLLINIHEKILPSFSPCRNQCTARNRSDI